MDKGRLNIDRIQIEQAKKEHGVAEGVVPRTARECFKWVLCPVMAAATDREPTIEVFPLARELAVLAGAASRDFFGTAYGQTGEAFDGFKLADPAIQVDPTLLLIEPGGQQQRTRPPSSLPPKRREGRRKKRLHRPGARRPEERRERRRAREGRHSLLWGGLRGLRSPLRREPRRNPSSDPSR